MATITTTADVDTYVLPRDTIDDVRINLQHYLWRQMFGYLVHPAVPIKNGMRIADVGTGTGSWMTDLASEPGLKDVQLEGLDISFTAAPPIEWLPDNIKFRKFDILADVPTELLGTYDIVHIRLFTWVLDAENIPGVLARLQSMLKPGGYLQWDEMDMESMVFKTARPGLKTTAIESLMSLSGTRDTRLFPTWAKTLSNSFQQAGFQDVQNDERFGPDHILYKIHECNLLVHELLAKSREDVETAEKFAALIPEAVKETKAGAYMAFSRQAVIGRRA